MANEVNYGRIALIPKGDFAGDVQYDVGDVVSYEGSSYIAKRKPPVATLPTDTEYWQIASQGSKYIYINLTTAEYNERLTAYLADPSYIDPDTGTLFSETLYNVTDDYESLLRKAENITYTDTFMLGATDVQGIIDIIGDKVGNLEDNFLTASKSVYVDATNGDDTTGDGSQEKPWKTIQKAVDMCPTITRGAYQYYVILKAGTYEQNVNIYNLSTFIFISGEDYSSIDKADNTLIKGRIDVSNCNMIMLRGLKIESNDRVGVAINRGSNGDMLNCKLDKCRMNVDRATLSAIRCDVSNYTGDKSVGAIHCQGGIIELSNITGTGNNVAMTCGTNGGYGGLIYLGSNCSIEGSKVADYGGRIEFGRQGYQLIGSVRGANSVAIDSELYTEFLVKIKIPNTIVEFEVHLCSTELTTTAKRPSYGCMFASNDYYGGSINATNTSIKLDYIWRNGVSITDTTTMTVYGKR